MNKLSKDKQEQLAQVNVELSKALQGDNFVAQGTNVVKAIQICEVALEDGFELNDLLQLLALEPLFREVRKNIGAALDNLRTIPIDDRGAVGVAIYRNALDFANLGPVSWWVVQTFAVTGYTWEKISEAADTFNDLRRLGDAFISKQDTIPIIEEMDED